MKDFLKFVGGIAMIAVIFFSGCATTHVCYMLGKCVIAKGGAA